MDSLIDTPDSAGNAPEFSVSELSGVLKRMIEGEFSHVRVRGELGRVSRPASGHIYLDLKDNNAVLASVIWKGTANKLAMRPEEGMEVVATGRLTTFPGQSRYQLIIESMAPAGVGALMAMLEKRKAALAAEGLFEAARKQPLPYLPRVIGVVTSPSGAVIRDILHRLRDRFPTRVLIWPVVVQGEACAGQVAAAIKGFNALVPGGPIPRPDVLIVARGGGSVEDLWGFNEEIVVRAAAESAIPLISAVGHETDTTLIDLAADMRAPTPTAAAEMAVPVRADLMASLAGLDQRRQGAAARLLTQRRQNLRDLSRALPSPEALLAERRQSLDYAADNLPRALRHLTQQKRLALGAGRAGRFGPALLREGLLRREARLEKQGGLLEALQSAALHRRQDRFSQLAPRLSPALLSRRAERLGHDLAGFAKRLQAAQTQQLQAAMRSLGALDRTLNTLSYQATLARGYAVVRSGGKVTTRAADLQGSTAIEVEFADGRIDAQTGGTAPDQKPRKAPPPGKQGSLF